MNQNISIDSLYYHRWKIVISGPKWRFYLRWAYKTCVDDLSNLNFHPNFTKLGFTALLCGVGNETTADEFINFVISKNKKARIIIIDFGKEQIDAVTEMVQNRYASLNITIKRMDALELPTFLSNNSIDWIETDGFLEFLDKKSLKTLLTNWKKLLKEDGWITLREPASNSIIGTLIDHLRIWIAKKWLRITIYRYTKTELEKMLNEQRFIFTSGPTIVPTFKRYSIINAHV